MLLEHAIVSRTSCATNNNYNNTCCAARGRLRVFHFRVDSGPGRVIAFGDNDPQPLPFPRVEIAPGGAERRANISARSTCLQSQRAIRKRQITLDRRNI